MAIFKTSGQAIHFSYVIQAYDASPQSQMAIIMRNGVRQMDRSDASSGPKINFGGLTPLEVRGQCAMIRACVQDHLQPREAWALEARYSRDRDTKRFAIRELANYYGPVLGISADLVLALMWRQHVEKSRQKDFSLRAIASDYSVPYSTVQRAAKALDEHLHALEGMALSNLHGRFVEAGVIEQG
jgi:hypothetical protein